MSGVRSGATVAAAPDLLEAIVSATRRAVEVAEARRPRSEMERVAAGRAPLGEAFRARLGATPGFNVIAECKRRSPSQGILRADYDPVAIGTGYERHGAAAISVLTEPTFFDGALDHLAAVRREVSIPLLRKDFVVSEYQVVEARAHGADAILLIVAALDDATLTRLLAFAGDLDHAVLVEVHDRRELARALEAGAAIVGVNNRNLRTLEVDVEASRSLVEAIPADVVAVAESGLRTGADLAELGQAGYRAFLVGEALVTTDDPGESLAALLADAERARREAGSA